MCNYWSSHTDLAKPSETVLACLERFGGPEKPGTVAVNLHRQQLCPTRFHIRTTRPAVPSSLVLCAVLQTVSHFR